MRLGRKLGERGHEFGTVTGRPRRCGWFDAAMVRQAVKVGGVQGLALTKLDVLDGMDVLRICTGYDDRRHAFFSPSSRQHPARKRRRGRSTRR